MGQKGYQLMSQFDQTVHPPTSVPFPGQVAQTGSRTWTEEEIEDKVNEVLNSRRVVEKDLLQESRRRRLLTYGAIGAGGVLLGALGTRLVQRAKVSKMADELGAIDE